MDARRGADADGRRGDDRPMPAAVVAGLDHVVPSTLAESARLDLEEADVCRLGDTAEPARAAARDAERRAHAVRDPAPLAFRAVGAVVELDRLRGTALGFPPLELE